MMNKLLAITAWVTISLGVATIIALSLLGYFNNKIDHLTEDQIFVGQVLGIILFTSFATFTISINILWHRKKKEVQ